VAVLLVVALAAPAAAQAPDGPSPRLELEVSDASPIIGAVTAVEVRLRVTGATADWGPPRLLVNAGKLGPLIPSGAGDHSFLVRYELPTGRFPQVALLVAELPAPSNTWPGRPAQGLLALPLRAPASPAFRTDPGAQVTVLGAARDATRRCRAGAGRAARAEPG
jgi:hypothetical protein